MHHLSGVDKHSCPAATALHKRYRTFPPFLQKRLIQLLAQCSMLNRIASFSLKGHAYPLYSSFEIVAAH